MPGRLSSLVLCLLSLLLWLTSTAICSCHHEALFICIELPIKRWTLWNHQPKWTSPFMLIPAYCSWLTAHGRDVKIWMGMQSIGSCIWKLGPYLVILFGKHMEPLGGRTLLEKVHNWGWPLIVHSLISLLVFSLCLLLVVKDVFSQFLRMLDKTNASLCKLLLAIVFITSKSH